MTDHDDRLISLPYEPATTPSERSYFRAFLDIFRVRRNKTDERQQAAAEKSAPYHRADAERVLAQLGADSKLVEDFKRERQS